MNLLLNKYLLRLSSSGDLRFSTYERQGDMPFSVHLQFSSRSSATYNSWGNGDSIDDATGTALMEMIERIFFSYLSPFAYKRLYKTFLNPSQNISTIAASLETPLKHLHPANSNGVAIHVFKRKALESAMAELIERHTILYSLLFSIHPHGKYSKSIGGTNCYFFWWASPQKTTTVVGAVKSGDGYYYSSGCAKNFNTACLKAERELNSFLLLKSQSRENVDFKIKLDDIDSFNRYHRYSGDNRAFKFFSENLSSRMLPELDRGLFYFTEFPVPPIFKNLPKLCCVRVIHPDAQQLFFDNWETSYVNPRIHNPGLSLPDFPHVIA